MTDNEIIKALECCSNDGGKDDCLTCPNLKSQENWDCKEDLPTVALDLINHQKAEIERLEKILDKRCDVCPAVNTALMQFAERLKEKAYRPNPYPYIEILTKEDVDNLIKEMTEGGAE